MRRFLYDFAVFFTFVFLTTVVVTLLWNLVFHGRGQAGWETAFQLGVVLGSTLAWAKARERAEQEEQRSR